MHRYASVELNGSVHSLSIEKGGGGTVVDEEGVSSPAEEVADDAPDAAAAAAAPPHIIDNGGVPSPVPPAHAPAPNPPWFQTVASLFVASAVLLIVGDGPATSTPAEVK